MTGFFVLLIILAVVAVLVYRKHKKRVDAAVDAYQPIVKSWIDEHMPPKPDPFGEGFGSVAEFDAWAARFENAIYYNGVLKKFGKEPAVHFVSANGRIVVVK